MSFEFARKKGVQYYIFTTPPGLPGTLGDSACEAASTLFSLLSARSTAGVLAPVKAIRKILVKTLRFLALSLRKKLEATHVRSTAGFQRRRRRRRRRRRMSEVTTG